jgi:hypothetical protein
MTKLSEQQKAFLTQAIFQKLKEVINAVVSLSDKQKFYEAMFLLQQLSRFITGTPSLDEIKLLSLCLYVITRRYNEIFSENKTWLPAPFYTLFDSFTKEAEHVVFLYRRLRPECKLIALELSGQIKEEYKAKTGNQYEAYLTFHRTQKERKVVLIFWNNHLFSSLEKYKNEPSNLTHLDTIFVCLPKWTDSYYVAARDGINQARHNDFNQLLEKYLNTIEPLMPQIKDMTCHALDKLTIPDRSQVEQEIKPKYAQRIKELQETASVKIPKSSNKEERKKLQKMKNTAQEELMALQKQQDNEIEDIIKKVKRDRNILEKLKIISQNYKKRVLDKVARLILKELTGILWGISRNQPDIIQKQAKREVNVFIRSKMKECSQLPLG